MGVFDTGVVLVVGRFDGEYVNCDFTVEAGCPTETLTESFIGIIADVGTGGTCGANYEVLRPVGLVTTTASSFNGFNQGVFSAYFSASQATTLVPSDVCNRAEIRPVPNSHLSTTHVSTMILTWRSAGLLTPALRLRAGELEASWDVTLTQQSGSQLDATGEDYFQEAIPNLRNFAPDLFGEIVVAIEPNLSDFTNQTGYADGLENFGVGNQFIDNANSQFTLLGTTFGVPSVWWKTSIAIGIALASVVAGLSLTGDFRMGLLAFPLTISIMVLMGFGVLALVAIMTFMAALFLSYMFFLKGVT